MQKIELKIRTFPDPILSGVAKPVLKVTDYHRRLMIEMARLMYEVSGAGLASLQVGVNEALFVADSGSGLYKLINPKIVKQEGSQTLEEGCLSLPGIGVSVKRAQKIILQALDENARPVQIEAEDLLARVFQHEIDHLNGMLILDHAPMALRAKIEKKVRNY